MLTKTNKNQKSTNQNQKASLFYQDRRNCNRKTRAAATHSLVLLTFDL